VWRARGPQPRLRLSQQGLQPLLNRPAAEANLLQAAPAGLVGGPRCVGAPDRQDGHTTPGSAEEARAQGESSFVRCQPVEVQKQIIGSTLEGPFPLGPVCAPLGAWSLALQGLALLGD